MKLSGEQSASQYRWCLSLVLVLVVLAPAAIAFGHAATLWAYVENNHVYVEAFFMGGAKVQNSRIVVVDAKGKKLLEGKTDKEGKFDFAPPIKDDMKILLLIDKAHGSEFEIKKQDFELNENPSPAPSASSEQKAK